MFSVLIADDEEIIRFELRRIVPWEKLGFYIKYEAANGYEALEKLGNEHVDLLVSDIKMPKVDGLELYRELKEKGQCSCAVFLSGFSEFEYVRPALVLGALDYMLKPFEAGKVVEVLGRVHEYLVEKYNEQAEKHALMKTINNNLNAYPVDGEVQMLNHILQGDDKAIELVKQIITDSGRNGSDINYLRQLSVVLISNIVKSIVGRHSYLKKFYDTGELGRITLAETSSVEDIIEAAQSSIRKILAVIRGFKLNQKDNIVIKACEYVLKNIENDINLKDVSEHFFISRNYFCSLFKKETGENFLEYVTKAKIERAKILLKENNYKAYEVSIALGYKETAYFSKLFKKYTGYSPTEYRKHVIEVDKPR